MGVIAAFLVGYVVGARAGSAEFDDLVRSFNAIRASEEFADFTAAMRSHASHALHGIAGLISGESDGGLETTLSPQDVVDRVRSLVGRR